MVHLNFLVLNSSSDIKLNASFLGHWWQKCDITHLSLISHQSSAWTAISPACVFLSSPETMSV